MKTLETLKSNNTSLTNITPVNLLHEIYMENNRAKIFNSVGYILTEKNGTKHIELTHFSRYRYEKESGSWGDSSGTYFQDSDWKFEAKDNFDVEGYFPSTNNFNETFYSKLLLNIFAQNKYLYFGKISEERDYILLNTDRGVLKNNPITDLFFIDEYSLSLYLGGLADGKCDSTGHIMTKEEYLENIINRENREEFRVAFDLVNMPYQDGLHNIKWNKF